MSSAEEEQELTLIDHLIELRDRILKSVVAVVVLFLALFAFSNDIYTYVATPLLDALPEGSTMIAIDPTSPCLLYTSPSPRDQRGSRMPSSA